MAVWVVALSALAFWCERAVRYAAGDLFSWEVRVLWVTKDEGAKPDGLGRYEVGGVRPVLYRPTYPGTDAPLPTGETEPPKRLTLH